MTRIVNTLVLVLLSLNFSLGMAEEGFDGENNGFDDINIDDQEAKPLKVIPTVKEQIKLMKEYNDEILKMDHNSLMSLLSKFFLFENSLSEVVPQASTALYNGANQNRYLTILAIIFRGGGLYGLDFTEESGSATGKTTLLSLIEIFPLDQKGIDLFKSFVLSYKGGEELINHQVDIINFLNNKLPVDGSFTEYDYTELKKEGKPNFEYESFNYDESVTEFPENFIETREKARIQQFPTLMQENLKGSKDQVERVQELLKENYINPEKNLNITLIGTSGNGKTQFAKAMAIALFNEKEAMYKLTFTGKTGELNDYLRSSVGYVGSNEPTEFETWFVDRIEQDKGGIIVLDELLSFFGLNSEQVAAKVQTVNELYDLLDERVVKIGNQTYDVSKFHVVITGNALQEVFFGLQDNPDMEKELASILKRLTKKDIMNYFREVGIDAPKLARFGEIFVNGPLPKGQVKEVSQFILKDSLKSLKNDVKVTVSQDILDGIVSRMSTVELGMRDVNIGLSKVVTGPVSNIIFDMDGIKEIEGKLIDDKIVWFADGKEVALNSRIVNEESGMEEKFWVEKSEIKDETKIRTPQFDDLDIIEPIKVEPLELHITSVHEVKGHWMVDTLITGKSEAQTISNIPVANALGFVRYKDQDEYKASVLTRILKRNMSLEAGHRAPIHEGFYATGGGSSHRKPDEAPSDDLGKVNQNLDEIFANHLIKQYTDVSDEKTSQVFRSVLRDLMKESTDYVIGFGNSIKFADELVEMAINDRYLVEEVIDEYAEKQLAKLTVDHDEIFLNAINDGVKNMLKNFDEDGMPANESLLRAKMLKNIVHKSFTDIKSIREYEGASEELLNSLEAIKNATIETITKYQKVHSKGCMGQLRRIGQKLGKYFKKDK